MATPNDVAVDRFVRHRGPDRAHDRECQLATETDRRANVSTRSGVVIGLGHPQLCEMLL